MILTVTVLCLVCIAIGWMARGWDDLRRAKKAFESRIEASNGRTLDDVRLLGVGFDTAPNLNNPYSWALSRHRLADTPKRVDDHG